MSIEPSSWTSILSGPEIVSKLVSEYVGIDREKIWNEKQLRRVQEIVFKRFSDYQDIIKSYENLVFVYLDLDGVLIDLKSGNFDSRAINNLLGFLRSHRAVVVLSSFRRDNYTTLDLREQFGKHEFGKYIVGRTDHYEYEYRAMEIYIHILNNRILNNILIFDDQAYDFREHPLLQHYFVHVENLISERSIKEANEVLGKKIIVS
jgi:hypothetical protein